MFAYLASSDDVLSFLAWKKHKFLHIGCMFEFDHLILSHFTEDRPHKKMSHLISQFSKPLLCLEVSEHSNIREEEKDDQYGSISYQG